MPDTPLPVGACGKTDRPVAEELPNWLDEFSLLHNNYTICSWIRIIKC